MTQSQEHSTFPIPASMQDLERSPYNLLPYPADFEDADEAARAESFDGLVRMLETGNRALLSGGGSLFDDGNEGDGEEWMDSDRVQALYTLVRKSASLAPSTRSRTIHALCACINSLCDILASLDNKGIKSAKNFDDDGNNDRSRDDVGARTNVVSQSFRDALACHTYMLYCLMSAAESEAKVGKVLDSDATGVKGAAKKSARLKKGGNKASHVSKKKQNEEASQGAEYASHRAACANAMIVAAKAMSRQKAILWKRSVPDEAVASLPCRVAYQMLENSINVTQRKAFSGDEALGIIAATVDGSSASLLSTVVAALMDLLHSFEHMAPLVAEICCLMREDPISRLAVELLREVSRLDVSTPDVGGGGGGAASKASGVKNVAPFICELAARKPEVVRDNVGLVLPHLNSEPYQLRSAVVSAIGYILMHPSAGGNEIGDNVEGLEIDGDDRSIFLAARKKNTALLDVLVERVADINSFTRATVLKTWVSITESNCLPIDRINVVTSLAIDRLQDKAVIVRRAAMQLLTCLLENNPFLGSLNPARYQEKIRSLESYLTENASERVKAEMKASSLIAQQRAREIDDQSTPDIADDNKLTDDTIFAAALEAAVKEEEDAIDGNVAAEDVSEEYESKQRAYEFASSAVTFINLLEGSTAALECMLSSSNFSDITEALRFYVRARNFELPCAIEGMKQALGLVWSAEEKIQEEVIAGFIDVFIAVIGTSGEELLPVNQIVRNLITLVADANEGELASVEAIVSILVKRGKMPSAVLESLWQVARKRTGQLRAATLKLISMAASADRGILDSASRFQSLLEAGLGDDVEESRDWNTMRAAASALQQIGRAHAKVEEGSAKHLVLDHIIERLSLVAKGDWCRDHNCYDTQAWFSAAENAIDAIFAIDSYPEATASTTIYGMMSSLNFCGRAENSSIASALPLARFFFVLGHVSLKLLVYTEEISSGVARGLAAKAVARERLAATTRSDAGCRRGSIESTQMDEKDALEEELGISAGTEAEREQKVAGIIENDIIGGRNLLSLFGPLIVEVVKNTDGKFSNRILMQSAALALCKFMCVSSSFCENQLPLLFVAFGNAPSGDTILRANIVVALGDLAFRFPNAVEPYTSRFYGLLRDDSDHVRRHTLMVLTHLILNDMVKVKGQVCEIALCLEDNDCRIRDLSRFLFHELSKRSNNPIYNLLPDIISGLSHLNAVASSTFRNIMAFVLGFVKKERQIEMLVEKLCQRFPSCSSIQQKAAIAFCLASVKMNEKCIKCLTDNFKLYKNALFDDDVYKWMSSIVSKAKNSSSTPEVKLCVEEWEDKLMSENHVGVENEATKVKARKAKEAAAKRATKKAPIENAKAPRRRRRKQSDTTETDEAADEKTSDEDFGEVGGHEGEDDVVYDKENVVVEHQARRPAAGRMERE